MTTSIDTTRKEKSNTTDGAGAENAAPMDTAVGASAASAPCVGGVNVDGLLCGISTEATESAQFKESITADGPAADGPSQRSFELNLSSYDHKLCSSMFV